MQTPEGKGLDSLSDHYTPAYNKYLLNKDSLNEHKAQHEIQNTMLDETAPLCHTSTKHYK